MKGLAYVDFADDAHLAAAVGKNKQMFLGKKISIARSNPKQKRKDSTSHGASGEHGRLSGIMFYLCYYLCVFVCVQCSL